MTRGWMAVFIFASSIFAYHGWWMFWQSLTSWAMESCDQPSVYIQTMNTLFLFPLPDSVSLLVLD